MTDGNISTLQAARRQAHILDNFDRMRGDNARGALCTARTKSARDVGNPGLTASHFAPRVPGP